MIPYASFTYFGLLLYPVVPAVLLAIFLRRIWVWILIATLLMLTVQYWGTFNLWPPTLGQEIWLVLAYGPYQLVVASVFLLIRARIRSRLAFYVAVALGLLPLVVAKAQPYFAPSSLWGFLGISYATFRALDVIIPEGSIMMARYPAPMAAWSIFVPTVVETIVTSLASAMPEKIPAAHHALLGGSVVFFGIHPKSKRRFVVQSIEGGGWGGRPFEDGESATVSVCQGDVRNGSIEGIELKCPVLVRARALRRDSAGAGKFRGGLGIDMHVRNFVDGKWNFERANRKGCPAWGLWGGRPGESGGYYLRRPGESEYRAMHGSHKPVTANSEVIVRTGGGGGWGEPLERDPERVRWDVLEEFVSKEAAEEIYGVVLREDLSVDEAATRALRQRLKASPAKHARTAQA